MSKNSSTPQKTPMEQFAQAAKHIFTLSKGDVKKIKAKTPVPKNRKKK